MSTLTGQWFKSTLSPKDRTSTVGGSRSTNPLTGLLSEVFEVAKSKMLGRGSYETYRKIFFLNEGNAISDAVMFWADLQHSDQLRFAFEKTVGDTSTNSATMPSGYVSGDFMAPVGLIDAENIPLNPIPATTGTVGVWIMQRIPDGLSPETGALGRLRIAGDVAP